MAKHLSDNEILMQILKKMGEIENLLGKVSNQTHKEFRELPMYFQLPGAKELAWYIQERKA